MVCEWADPALMLLGTDWALRIMCPWWVERSGLIEFESNSADVGDRVWDIIARVRARQMPGKPFVVVDSTGSHAVTVMVPK